MSAVLFVLGSGVVPGQPRGCAAPGVGARWGRVGSCQESVEGHTKKAVIWCFHPQQSYRKSYIPGFLLPLPRGKSSTARCKGVDLTDVSKLGS